MATKKVTTTTIQEGDDSQEIELEREPDTEDENVLAKLMEFGGGSDVTWTVRKISPASEAGWCSDYNSDDLTMTRLREEWGAGKYSILGRKAGKYVKSATVVVAPLPKGREPQPLPAANPSDGLAGVLDAMERRAAAAAEASERRSAETMRMFMDMNAKMMEAVMRRPDPPPPVDVLTIITQLAPILKPEKAGTDGVEMLMRGLELGKDLGSGGGTDVMDLIGKGLTTFGPALASGLMGAKSVPVPAVNPVKPAALSIAAPIAPQAVQNAPTVPTTHAEAPMIPMLKWLNAQVNALVHQASRDRDPGLYADVFLDNLPEFLSVAQIREQMSAPDALTKLQGFNVNVGKYLPWFEAFRDCVLERINEIAPPNNFNPAQEDTTGTDSQNDYV